MSSGPGCDAAEGDRRLQEKPMDVPDMVKDGARGRRDGGSGGGGDGDSDSDSDSARLDESRPKLVRHSRHLGQTKGPS